MRYDSCNQRGFDAIPNGNVGPLFVTGRGDKRGVHSERRVGRPTARHGLGRALQDRTCGACPGHEEITEALRKRGHRCRHQDDAGHPGLET